MGKRSTVRKFKWIKGEERKKWKKSTPWGTLQVLFPLTLASLPSEDWHRTMLFMRMLWIDKIFFNLPYIKY
jgi:hypothetical protein